jgi:hypothetical protein
MLASVGVRTGNGRSDDEFWRRPAEPTGGQPARPTGPPAPETAGRPTAEPGPAGYSGPPPTSPPPPGWRPPVVSLPPPPRRLPDQDLNALDESEASARTLTYGLAMIAGAVLVVVSCLLCSRVLF